jgi:hypothetical protein
LYVPPAAAAPPGAADGAVETLGPVDALAVDGTVVGVMAAAAARCVVSGPVQPAAIRRIAPHIAGSRQR